MIRIPRKPDLYLPKPAPIYSLKFYSRDTGYASSIDNPNIIRRDKNFRYIQHPIGVHKTLKQHLKSLWDKFSCKTVIRSAFLPQNYPNSVFPQYTPFIKWLFLQNIMGSAVCVLSTQSLLLAVGVGASNSLKVAATFQWVIKDALGQIGGILAAGALGKGFDLYTKQLRFLAVLGLAAASLIEIATLQLPSSFLLLASFANLVKNVCWVTSSATRASLLRAFSREENLGDLTAKHASQGTAASLIGTGLGLCMSHLFSLSSFFDFFMAYIPFSCGLYIGLYQTTKNIRSSNLNYQTLLSIFEKFKASSLSKEMHSENLLQLLDSYRLSTFVADRSNLSKAICINHPLDLIASNTDIWDGDGFLLSLNRESHAYLWIKEHSSHIQVIEAVLYGLFWSVWNITPPHASRLVKLFVSKLENETAWNLESFVLLSPEITARPMIKLSAN